MTESTRHYIHISESRRHEFPPANKKFHLIAKGESFEVEIDKKNRMWIAVLQLKFKFITGMIFEIETDGYRTYKIRQLGTSDFPNFAVRSQLPTLHRRNQLP